MKTLLSLLAMAVGTGWILRAVPINTSAEVTIQVTVTKESLAKAIDHCGTWKRQAGGYTGYVALYNTLGQHYSMPCSAEMEGM